jgi:hypothetical protein
LPRIWNIWLGRWLELDWAVLMAAALGRGRDDALDREVLEVLLSMSCVYEWHKGFEGTHGKQNG